MPGRISRNQEEFQRLQDVLPLIDILCKFEPIGDQIEAEEFKQIISRRLDKLKQAFALVDAFRRRL